MYLQGLRDLHGLRELAKQFPQSIEETDESPEAENRRTECKIEEDESFAQAVAYRAEEQAKEEALEAARQATWVIIEALNLTKQAEAKIKAAEAEKKVLRCKNLTTVINKDFNAKAKMHAMKCGDNHGREIKGQKGKNWKVNHTPKDFNQKKPKTPVKVRFKDYC